LNDNPATGSTRNIKDDPCNIYPQMEGRPETSQIQQTRYQARQSCRAFLITPEESGQNGVLDGAPVVLFGENEI
jgi:hypothetical protein